jgi:hypothetical protein
MLSHDCFRTPPLLRTDSTQWHTTGQLWIRWFFSLADGARPKEVSSKRFPRLCFLKSGIAAGTDEVARRGQSGMRVS